MVAAAGGAVEVAKFDLIAARLMQALLERSFLHYSKYPYWSVVVAVTAVLFVVIG